MPVLLPNQWCQSNESNSNMQITCKLAECAYYLKTASKAMTMVLISQPAFPNALGIANAPVPTIKLNT